MINDDEILEMSETFTVSVDLLTQVSVSDASILNTTITILDDEGTISSILFLYIIADNLSMQAINLLSFVRYYILVS